MSDHQSCLVQKLSHYIAIDETAAGHLAALEKTERTFRRHAEVWSEGDETGDLFVIRKGWCYSYTDMPDGRRQIVRVLHPGDVIGFPDIAFQSATTNIRTAEEVCLCPFPKARLDVIFRESPRLTALLFTLANRELACMVDSLRAMGRMSARERIAFFLLDLVSRLRITNASMTDTLRMPLNQHEIGDALGLTHTYVSKTLGRMEDGGLLRRAEGTITLENEERLKEMVEFTNRYEALDTSWFPTAH